MTVVWERGLPNDGFFERASMTLGTLDVDCAQSVCVLCVS